MKLAILYQQSEPPAKDGTKELIKIKEDCVAASQALKIKGLVRIDCREDKNGAFKIFDFNAKPNITGGVPGLSGDDRRCDRTVRQGCGVF